MRFLQGHEVKRTALLTETLSVWETTAICHCSGGGFAATRNIALRRLHGICSGTCGLTTFEWIIALLLGAVALSALARQIKVPYPTFLAIGGVLLAFVPSGPS